MTTSRITVCGLLLIALCGIGCARGYTRLFQPTSRDQILVDNYRVYPRITAFRNATESAAEAIGNGFWTSLKVYDTTITVGNPKDSIFLAQRDSLAQEFLGTTLHRFVVDSLVLAWSSGTGRQVFPTDKVKFAPRDVNYLSYNFGQIAIPRGVTTVTAVFFYRLYGNDGELVRSDSLVIPMARLETDQMLITDFLEADSAKGFRGN